MTAKDEYVLSIYEELSDVGNHNNAKLVKSSVDGMLYVKKIITNYNLSVYERLRKINISGIPKIHELIEADGELIVIEDYINGRNLEEISEGKMSVARAKDIVVSLCDILSEIHHMNPPIVHRDIKPENVVLTNDNKVYLIDFNISRQFVDNKRKDTVIMGTSGYAAPEQFGFAQTDARADIYSMGILMRNITGIRENAQYKDEIKWNRIIEKCIQIDPKARYQDVDELRKVVSKAFENNEVETNRVEDSFLPPGYRSRKINNMIIATIVYALIVLCAASFKQTEDDEISIVYVKVAFVGMCLGYIFSFYNWRGMLNILPEIFRKNVILKICVSVAVAVLCVFAVAFVAAIIA